MAGIVSYGAYIPTGRLQRADITAVLGENAGKGARAIASFDEDTTTMAVAAARDALAPFADRSKVAQLVFATSAPAYLDKTNATAIHAATGLPDNALALDMIGAVRSGAGALILAAQSKQTTLVALADMRTGLPGGADEREGGDAAAAFLFADDDKNVIAEIVAHASATDEFLDRWKPPAAAASRVWEERFGAEAYAPLFKTAFKDALQKARLEAGQVDHLIVAGLHARAGKDAQKASKVSAAAIVDDSASQIGNSGCAQIGVQLADVLDRAQPDQTIVVAVLSDGASVLVLRTTKALADRRARTSVASQLKGGRNVPYATFLSWRGLLEREPQRRPRPVPPYAPPAYRRRDWKFSLIAGRCSECDKRQIHAGRVCAACGALDKLRPEPMADVPATVVIKTVDRLAFSPQPPLTMAIVNFDGGGRLRCQVTDVDEKWPGVGQRVAMTFRRIHTADGVHNYFWKARPLHSTEQGDA